LIAVNTHNVFGFSLLLLAAIGSWYLTRSLQDTNTEVSRTQMIQSGFYLRSARILGTAIDGRLLYEINADYAEQQDNNEVEFQNVEIHYTTDTEVPWVLKSDTALIGNDRNHITLSGHVLATSKEGFSGEVTEIRTQHLELDPQKFTAMTDEYVQISIGMRSITATGMLAMLQTNQLQLKSNVSGKFVP